MGVPCIDSFSSGLLHFTSASDVILKNMGEFRLYLTQVKHNKCEPMMTSSNGDIFRVTDPLCGNSPVTSEFPSQRPVTWSFDIFFDLRLNKRLSKQPWGWWFETPSRSLWRHCNDMHNSRDILHVMVTHDCCCYVYISWHDCTPRADSRFVPDQWETALLCNGVSHWLGTNLESALCPYYWYGLHWD